MAESAETVDSTKNVKEMKAEVKEASISENKENGSSSSASHNNGATDVAGASNGAAKPMDTLEEPVAGPSTSAPRDM